jgi:hypothetical protein
VSWFPKIRGTSEQFFSALFGTLRTQWKNNSGAWEARNDADSGFIIGRGATPVGANDWATKAYVDSATGTGADVLEIRFTLGTATTSSATNVPIGALVVTSQIKITTPYSVGATLSLGQSGSVTEFMGVGDNNPQGTAGDLFEVPQDTAAASTSPVLATVGGAPGAGAAVVVVRYVVTPEG